jgi:hypothetical protein
MKSVNIIVYLILLSMCLMKIEIAY